MTTLYQFKPTVTRPYEFIPTLDDQGYAARVVWNLFGARYYIELRALNGLLVFSLPLIGSPIGFEVNSISWANGRVTGSTTLPHGYKIGSTIALTLVGFTPEAYNGKRECVIESDTDFSYAQSSPIDIATKVGIAEYNINLAAGYFTTSTLVFREASQLFEVTP